MRTAAAYIRVSTEDQIEFSPDSQLAKIREYAKRNDLILPQEFVFIDAGISGRTAEKRPQFMNMMAMAKQKPKPFDVILLWKFSRFARNREDSILYKSMLRRQCGIDVVSISENIGNDKMSILIEALIEAMDEFYSINLSEEVKRGMTEKAKRGGVLSVPAFGYGIKGGKYIPVAEEAEVIRTVFSRYNEGASMLGIAKELNAIGVRTHRGGKIESRTIEYWLNNPIYIGKTRWTPTGAVNRDYHNPNSMISDGQHEPLIDNDTWEAAQERMKAQKERYMPYHKESSSKSHWLVSLVRCGICGGSLVNCAGYFRCNNLNKGTCPGNGSISAKRLQNIVIRQLREIMASAAYVSIPIRKSEPKHYEPDFMLKMQIKKAYGRLDKIKEAYEYGIDSIEEYRTNKHKITAEIERLEAEINKVHQTASQKDFKVLQGKISEAVEILEDDTVTALERHEIAKEFIEEICKTGLDGKEYIIFYRL